jgi:transposase InsO family protein
METCTVCNRKNLVELVESGVSIAEAARLCQMSRAKAYKWLGRFKEGGASALEDRSRTRVDSGRFEGSIAEFIVELRRKHPTWGPRKLLQFCKRQKVEGLPSASTIGALLTRSGMVKPRQRRTIHVPFRYSGPTPTEPNELWTMDFKGDFRLGNGKKCLPFTLREAASRKILSIRAMTSPKTEPVQAELERCFAKYGLPIELQSDGGPPFATKGISCLSGLSVWLLKLDIIPVLSRPAKPQDNGGHERMHRDLKAETTRPPGRDVYAQQKKFDAFTNCFNEERPHDALEGKVPEECWKRSPRELPTKIACPDYPAWWEVRRINTQGTFSWHDRPVKISEALGKEDIGLEPIDDGLWRIHFYRYVIGLFDERRGKPVVTSIVKKRGRVVHGASRHSKNA